MKRTSVALFAICVVTCLVVASAPAFAQPAGGVPKQIRDNFNDVDRKILEMARDWPADNYNYKLRKEMRSFGGVMVHLVAGNIYAAKIGRGEKANWDELDASKYPDKASIVALLEKSFADSEAVLKGLPDATFAKSVEPWLGVMEHNGEHYGLLVAYYRANGMTPPESRPKK